MKICPHCGFVVRESDVEGYSYVCLYCDENFYEFEVEDVDNGSSTYMSFHYNDDYANNPPVVIRLMGKVNRSELQKIGEEFVSRWDEIHESREFPDSDENVVVDLLNRLNVPYQVVDITYSAEY